MPLPVSTVRIVGHGMNLAFGLGVGKSRQGLGFRVEGLGFRANGTLPFSFIMGSLIQTK